MIHDRPLTLDVNVPRYTSYPTAAQFSDAVGRERHAAWLSGAGQGRTALYIHVPFCRSLCWYCACNMQVVNRPDALADYAEILIREAALVASMTGAVSPVAVQWGGGTPTHLGPDLFRRTAEAIQRILPRAAGAEHSVEIDPRTFGPALAEALACSGVNRASLGVQDFDPEVQRAINRHQTPETTARTVDDLRRVGIDRVNIDLVYGLPCQTVGGLEHTLDETVALAPDRLAVFGYAHVPWMKAHQKLIPEDRLPDGDTRLRMTEAIARRLLDAGYVRIGLDHFARAGDSLAEAARHGRLHRNFQGYTDVEADATIGLGASAISDLPGGLVQNAVAVRDYARSIGDGRLATARGVARTGEDRLRGRIIERLMCDFRVDVADLACREGMDPAILEGVGPELRAHEAAGHLVLDGDRIEITPAGRPWARVIAARFDAWWRPSSSARHSRAV